jgi:hypothetical protein
MFISQMAKENGILTKVNKECVYIRWEVRNKITNLLYNSLRNSVDYSVQNLIYTLIEIPVRDSTENLIQSSARKLIKELNEKY